MSRPTANRREMFHVVLPASVLWTVDQIKILGDLRIFHREAVFIFPPLGRRPQDLRFLSAFFHRRRPAWRTLSHPPSTGTRPRRAAASNAKPSTAQGCMR